MVITDYSEPLTQLFALGECNAGIFETWLDYGALGITEKDIPGLIAIATDNDLYELDDEMAENWAPVHAWRALSQLQATDAISPLLEQFQEYQNHEGWHDWMINELPRVFSTMGSPAIPFLAEAICDRTKIYWFRDVAIESLTNIALGISEVKPQCIAILQEELTHFQENESDINSFLIDALVELRAVEAAPVIEQVFAANKVDELFCGDWNAIQVDLGLKSADEVPLPRYRVISPEKALSPQLLGFSTNHQQQKAKKKAKRKQQAESRRKNRKKK
jgi:Protein of unknown function (DUF1186)